MTILAANQRQPRPSPIRTGSADTTIPDPTNGTPLPPLPDAASTTRIRAESHFPSVSESRVRLIVAGGLVLLVIGCLCLKLLYPFNFISHAAPGSLLHWLLPRLKKLVEGWPLEAMVIYPFGVLVIFALERLFPAVPTQKTLSTGLIHDGLWELIDAATYLVIARWYGQLLYVMYARHLSFLTLTVASSLPVAVRMAIGILIMDFARWFQHWLHHKVPWLWPFHAIHHSQRELNMSSTFRNHFVELYVNFTVMALPVLVLGLKEPQVVWWILLVTWHARLEHANIKSDFGPLRYLLVTPQSHRVHHSRHSEHFDCNYGALLSIWDYLFGTQYRRYDVYPETGVDDEQFPTETAKSVPGVLVTPVRQTFYPFQYLWMMSRRRKQRQ